MYGMGMGSGPSGHAGIAMHCYLMLQRRRLELERLLGEKKAHFNCRDIWVNYNELTTSSLEIIVSKGNHPQIALIQVSELL